MTTTTPGPRQQPAEDPAGHPALPTAQTGQDPATAPPSAATASGATGPADEPAASALAGAAVQDTDRVLTARARAYADTLAAHIIRGMVDYAGGPGELPELLFPDIPPEYVQRIWKAALPVGYRVGKAMARPVWDTAALDRVRAALTDTGHTGMAAVIDRAAPAAERDAATTRPAGTDRGARGARDGGPTATAATAGQHPADRPAPRRSP